MSRMPSHVGVALAGAALLAVAPGASAEAASHPTPRVAGPHAVTGPLIERGADGSPRALTCPPDEHVLGGGYLITPEPGRRLNHVPADVLETQPNAGGTTWVVEVRKYVAPAYPKRAEPANLTLRIVCGPQESTPGG